VSQDDAAKIRELFLINLITYGNIPYIWGGQDEDGLDCSGFVQRALELIGLDPEGDQTAQALYHHFTEADNGHEIYPWETSDLGDLLFYGRDKRSITHISIYLGQQMLVEAGGGGARTTTREIAEQMNAKVRIRQIGHRKDMVAIVRPNGLPWVSATKGSPTDLPT